MSERPDTTDYRALFLSPTPMMDMRAPAEFTRGAFPSALSLPLMSDDERAQVGICYKQQGQDSAVERGLDLVGPKMADFVRRSRQLYQDQVNPKPLLIHCWRGGMRSGSLAWLLATAGYSVHTAARWIQSVPAMGAY